MKKQNLQKLMVIVIILAVVIFSVIVSFYKESKISNFEECAAAGNPVGESYPRQCIHKGKVFTEFIEGVEYWKQDGIFLTQNSETGEYACFGCGKTMCIDPILIMKPVEETPKRYCNEDFEIIEEKEKFFCPQESRNVDACIEIYQPVCGWSDPDKIKCIKFPCASTYSNSCFACMDENVLYYTREVCPE